MKCSHPVDIFCLFCLILRHRQTPWKEITQLYISECASLMRLHVKWYWSSVDFKNINFLYRNSTNKEFATVLPEWITYLPRTFFVIKCFNYLSNRFISNLLFQAFSNTSLLLCEVCLDCNGLLPDQTRLFSLKEECVDIVPAYYWHLLGFFDVRHFWGCFCDGNAGVK